MVKIIIAGRRRAGLTRAGLSRHLQEVHGPMVVTPPADAGPMPSGYVQNHVRDGVRPADGPELDFVTEVWFPSPEMARASVSTPYYETTLRPDEPRFVDVDSVRRCVAIEQEVKAGQPAGSQKGFMFWAAADGFDSAWPAAQAAQAAECNHAVRWVANQTRPMPGPPALPYAGIDEIWLEPGADMQPLFDAMLARLGHHVDTAGSCFVVVEEFTTARLRGA